MIRLRFEPERLTDPSGLVADLLRGVPKAIDLLPEGAFDHGGEVPLREPAVESRLRAEFFRCPPGGATARLERVIAGGGRVVTTGQQPQLFGGPLYVLYKALTAVRLAIDHERRSGEPCVAVFWVAADDHDWHEVASVGFTDVEERYRRIEVPLPSTATGLSVGPIPLPSEIAPLTDEFVSSLEIGDGGERWSERLREWYAPGRSFSEAFLDMACEWMEGLPIAFLDSAQPAVRRASNPLVERVIDLAEAADGALHRGAEAVTALGHRPQMAYVPGAIPVFRQTDAGRYRLRGTSGIVQIDREGETADVGDLLEEVRSHPGRFSPSAALRPALESWLMPVAATVLGPGEIAYWAQLGPLFETLDVPMPAIIPRDSWRIVEPRVARLLRKTGAGPEDLRDGAEAAARDVVTRSRPRSVEAALHELEERLERGYEELGRVVGEEMPGLRSAVGKSRSQALAATAGFRRTMDGVTRERESRTLEQVRRAAAHLYPGGIPQERAVATHVYLSRYGDAVLEAARQAAFGEGPYEPGRAVDGVAGPSSAE